MAAEGSLRSRFVLHVVPPLHTTDTQQDDDDIHTALTEAYSNVLNYVNELLKSSSVIMPELGTGE